MTRDQHYLNRLAHYLGEGLDLIAARDMAAIVTAMHYPGTPGIGTMFFNRFGFWPDHADLTDEQAAHAVQADWNDEQEGIAS